MLWLTYAVIVIAAGIAVTWMMRPHNETKCKDCQAIAARLEQRKRVPESERLLIAELLKMYPRDQWELIQAPGEPAPSLRPKSEPSYWQSDGLRTLYPLPSESASASQATSTETPASRTGSLTHSGMVESRPDSSNSVLRALDGRDGGTISDSLNPNGPIQLPTPASRFLSFDTTSSGTPATDGTPGHASRGDA